MQKKPQFLVAIAVVMSLVGGLNQAVAQGSGSYLTNDLSADVNGAEARISVKSLDAFRAEGSEAVLQPGTEYEERFTYSTVDTATNELVGITRETPIAHPAGSFVEEIYVAAAPEPSPTPDPTTQPVPLEPEASSESTLAEDESSPQASVDELTVTATAPTLEQALPTSQDLPEGIDAQASDPLETDASVAVAVSGEPTETASVDPLCDLLSVCEVPDPCELLANCDPPVIEDPCSNVNCQDPLPPLPQPCDDFTIPGVCEPLPPPPVTLPPCTADPATCAPPAPPCTADPVTCVPENPVCQNLDTACVFTTLADAPIPPMFMILPVADVVVDPASGNSCSYQGWMHAGYGREGFNIAESGATGMDGNCNRGYPVLRPRVWIFDHGVQVMSSTYSTSDSDSDCCNAEALAHQQVPIYTFPSDWHGTGSLIEWRFMFEIEGPWGGKSIKCYRGAAILPGPINIAPEPCTPD